MEPRLKLLRPTHFSFIPVLDRGAYIPLSSKMRPPVELYGPSDGYRLNYEKRRQTRANESTNDTALRAFASSGWIQSWRRRRTGKLRLWLQIPL